MRDGCRPAMPPCHAERDVLPIVAQRERMMQRPAFPEAIGGHTTNSCARAMTASGSRPDGQGRRIPPAAAAQRGARRFIVNVLNSERRFEETGYLDWAFDTYVERVVVAGGLPIGDADIERWPTRCPSRRLRPWSSWTR